MNFSLFVQEETFRYYGISYFNALTLPFSSQQSCGKVRGPYPIYSIAEEHYGLQSLTTPMMRSSEVNLYNSVRNFDCHSLMTETIGKSINDHTLKEVEIQYFHPQLEVNCQNLSIASFTNDSIFASTMDGHLSFVHAAHQSANLNYSFTWGPDGAPEFIHCATPSPISATTVAAHLSPFERRKGKVTRLTNDCDVEQTKAYLFAERKYNGELKSPKGVRLF